MPSPTAPWAVRELLSMRSYDIPTSGGPEVSDTLDLTLHAALAFNALIGTVDERGEFLFSGSLCPPSLRHDSYSFAACGPKYMESLAMMSLMTGIHLDATDAQKQIDYLLIKYGVPLIF